jgi:hypothetical protein
VDFNLSTAGLDRDPRLVLPGVGAGSGLDPVAVIGGARSGATGAKASIGSSAAAKNGAQSGPKALCRS